MSGIEQLQQLAASIPELDGCKVTYRSGVGWFIEREVTKFGHPMKDKIWIPRLDLGVEYLTNWAKSKQKPPATKLFVRN